MKTIKTILLLLLSTLFLSCSETYDDDVFFEETVERITYHYKQYYEDPIVIDKLTTDEDFPGYDNSNYDSKTIFLGSLVYQQRYQRNEVIDTLTIDLSSFNEEIDLLVLGNRGTRPNEIENKYITVNYLKIIGFYENPNLVIRGNDMFDKITIYNSNVPVEDLNRISRTIYTSWDMFQKQDYERKEWSFSTYVLDNLPRYSTGNGESTEGYIGFIGYDNPELTGLKLEIVDITEHYD